MMKFQEILGAGAIAIAAEGCVERGYDYSQPAPAPVTVYDQPNGVFDNCDVYTDSPEVGSVFTDREFLDLCSGTYEDIVTCLRLDEVDGGAEIQADLISCLDLYEGTRSIDYEYAQNPGVFSYNCVPGDLQDLICR